MPLDLAAAIEDFWIARSRGEFFPQAYAGRLTLDDAYRIQLALIERRVAAGERHIGWKVGLTAKVIQEQFGFHEPVFGCILETRPTGHVFAAGELTAPGFETELCMRIARPPARGASLDEVRGSIAAIHPSFEIVETRGDFVHQIELAMADNAQQRSVILGEPVRPDGLDLSTVPVRVRLNGEEVASGTGAAVLGNPLRSVAWLAGKLAEYGRGLRKGDLVMTGSFVRQFALAPGDSASAEFAGVGAVTVGIER